VEHRVVQALGIPGALPEAPGYFNPFRAVPAERTYRPPRVTPRPRIHGLVTGFIDAGDPSASASYARIDEQGRYLVRFMFDATPSESRPPSRPVRMVQNHAGENYGTHFPLKPDVEVVIGFIDGDPDRPVIVGALPNPLMPSPVTSASPGVHRIRTSSGITVDIVE
jgi:type VI secretion system secreted protein VgrG